MKEIGGFFELELNHLNEYHINSIRLNTGRNCLEYILRVKEYKKVYLPYFICDVVLEPIIKLGIEYEFYRINAKFEPLFEKLLKDDEALLYVNYFGLKQQFVRSLSSKYINLIIDNTQAFFSKPVSGVDTFYSPRKFIGVSDGGYLYTDELLDVEFERDVSFDRMSHLLKRIDCGASIAYNDFKENSEVLIGSEILKMSNVTQSILNSIDYKSIKIIREINFIFLHKELTKYNELEISIDNLNGPMIYPFMIKDNKLRQLLIDNKIFVAKYWPNVIDWCGVDDLEYKMTEYILPIPVDQRYGVKELKFIVELLKNRIYG